MKTFEQLMAERHAAYLTAFAGGFHSDGDTSAWRRANRAYVLARDAAQDTARNVLGRAA
jgi:hypothetical protein